MTTTAKVFMNGRSQAVRLPAEFRFEGTEVFIERQGDAVILRPKPVGWDAFFAAEPRAPDDFLAERSETSPSAPSTTAATACRAWTPWRRSGTDGCGCGM